MKCLVTGAAGFIGSHLCERLLNDGNEVVGVDSFTDAYDPFFKEMNVEGPAKAESFTLIRDDLLALDPDVLLESVDFIFHQAAQAGVRSSWGREFSLYTERNVLATQRLLEACKGKPVKKFVYASSSSVYGDAAGFPTTEDAVPCPMSPYGVTKLAAEHLCNLYWKNHGVPAISLRYFTVYGPRQRPDMAFHLFLKALMTGESITLFGDGNQTRDFTYVSDIVEANVLAAESPHKGVVYNIGGGSRVSLWDVLAELESVTRIKPKIETSARRHGDVRHTSADLSRAKADLSYEPKITLKEGLEKESQWMRSILDKNPEIS